MIVNTKWVIGAFAVLWLVGFIQVPFLNTSIFDVFGRPFTVHHLLLILLLGYLMKFLPTFLRGIMLLIIAIWLVSTFILPFYSGIVNILFLIVIVMIFFSFV